MHLLTLWHNCRKLFEKAFDTFRSFLRRFFRKYILLNVSSGNLKLKPDMETRYIIWNLPAVKTCPFRTKECEKNCYALKSERNYPDVLPARQRNFAETLRSDFVHNMTETIKELAEKPSYKKAIRVVVRIHESGDFYSQKYFDKWLEIANNIKAAGYNNVLFMAYTKSIVYLENRTLPNNFHIRASIWADTKPEMVEMSKKYNIYTAYDKKTIEEMKAAGKDFFLCTCENCSTCNQCWSDRHKLIIVEIH